METSFPAFAIALVATALLTFPARWLALRFGVVDRPNARSSHQVPTPRAGGSAIVLGVAGTVVLLVPIDPGSIRSGLIVLAVAAVSLLDDVRSLSFVTRLVVQSASAVAIVTALDLPVRSLDLPGWSLALPHGVGLALGVLFVVAYANFFNFMDGINGLAAGQALLTAAVLSSLLAEGDCGTAAVVAAAVAGAAGGFLPHNVPRARVFMGDSGSVTLGFGLAVLSQVAHARAGVPWTAVLLIHGVFLFDPAFTILKRAWRGESIVTPHREHGYQLLVRAGWSHTATTSAVLALSAGCGAAGYAYARGPVWVRWAALLGTTMILALSAVWAHAVGADRVAHD